jgi:hypothetical protein
LKNVPQTEERRKEIKAALVESYMYCCGMDRATAELAAGANEGQRIITAFNVVESLDK